MRGAFASLKDDGEKQTTAIVRPALFRDDRFALVVPFEVAEGDLVVVGEEDQPVLGDGAGEEALALGDAGEGVEVVAHDPGGVEVVVGGDEVADVAGVVAVGFDVDAQHAGGVAGEGFDPDAFGDLA